MNVSLTAELEKFVEEQVESGLYHSASEVVRDGLRLLKRVAGTEDVKAWYNAQIDLALEQLERGEIVSGEESYARMKARLFNRNQDKAAS